MRAKALTSFIWTSKARSADTAVYNPNSTVLMGPDCWVRYTRFSRAESVRGVAHRNNRTKSRFWRAARLTVQRYQYHCGNAALPDLIYNILVYDRLVHHTLVYDPVRADSSERGGFPLIAASAPATVSSLRNWLLRVGTLLLSRPGASQPA